MPEDSAREVHPFVVLGPGYQNPSDFGAYPVPSDWPEPDPKDVKTAEGYSVDLIPELQENTPVTAEEDLKQAFTGNLNPGNEGLPVAASQ
jgi:hypothetical protein